MMLMRKELIITSLVLLGTLSALLILTGCKPERVTRTSEPLFNNSLNEKIENLTVVEEPEEFEEFMFNYTPRNDSKYEIAEDDVFTITRGNFTSTEISFFGVMLGDSYDSVIKRLGIPDVMFIPADQSYKNLEYRKRIGISGKFSGLTFHLENDTVTRITVKPAFNKYLHGNTSIGTDKEVIYALLDLPDYQDFVSVFRVFHYVEKGVEIYFKNRYVNRISFVFPKEFKGVEYVTAQKVSQEGVLVNITEPVLTE